VVERVERLVVVHEWLRLQRSARACRSVGEATSTDGRETHRGRVVEHVVDQSVIDTLLTELSLTEVKLTVISSSRCAAHGY